MSTPQGAYTATALIRQTMNNAFRPSKPGSQCTKAQQAEIRKSCSLSLAKARSEAKYCTQTPATPAASEASQGQVMSTSSQSTPSPFHPSTPPLRERADTPPVTSRTVYFAIPQLQNEFDILMDEKL
jgi:hypothetical protein